MLRAPGPSTNTRAISSTKNGNATTTSTTRMMTRSNHPPKYAAMAPSTVPSTNGNSTAMNAIRRSTRAP